MVVHYRGFSGADPSGDVGETFVKAGGNSGIRGVSSSNRFPQRTSGGKQKIMRYRGFLVARARDKDLKNPI